MRKITETDYSLLTYFNDTVLDFIEEKKDNQFIYAYLGFKDKNGNQEDEFFDVLLTEDEYNKLRENPYIYITTETEERGKAGIYETLMNIAEQNCTTDLEPVAPLTYILKKDEDLLNINAKKRQSKLLKEVLFNHITERGYLLLKDKFEFYFSLFL